MNRTKIEWCDYTINPIKGLCKHACWYCYARRMYKRFKWNEEVRLDLSVLDRITEIKQPSKIFLCSTHDLFGEWIPDKWIFDIITKCQQYSQHTFLLLTKNPARYLDWTFRNNFWIGITNTGEPTKLDYLSQGDLFAKMTIVFDKFKNNFISFEPLLKEFGEIPSSCKWIIIGAMTGQGKEKYIPKENWIVKILYEADKFRIPVFMKNNLKSFWNGRIRQEFPNWAGGR